MQFLIQMLLAAAAIVVSWNLFAQETDKPRPSDNLVDKTATPPAVSPLLPHILSQPVNQAKPDTNGMLVNPPTLLRVDPTMSPTPITPASPETIQERKEDREKRAVFVRPTPINAGDDPRVIAAKESTKSIERTLATVREHLKTINESYDSRKKTTNDLKAVSVEMMPLVKVARVDAVTMMHAAQDLMITLPLTRDGLEQTARLYRQKAMVYKDKDLQKITDSLADEFDRLANDVPRRMQLTSDFILQMNELNTFLAEADRCLHDTAAAMEILNAGNEAPRASIEGIAFRLRVKQYMAVLDEYQKKLSAPPSAEVQENEPEDPKKAAAPVANRRRSSPLAPPLPDVDVREGAPAPAAKQNEKKDDDADALEPIDERAQHVKGQRDAMRPGTVLRGRYIEPAGLLPLQVVIRSRNGNRISGDIYVNTAYGQGNQKFTGEVNGDSFILNVRYGYGPLMKNPETWNGRLNSDKITGKWASDAYRGEFWLDYTGGMAVARTR
jgi:hypothetical protein